MMKKKYDPNKEYRSNLNFTTSYTPVGKGKIMLSVGCFGLETLVSKIPDGDGMTFNSIDEARAFALNKGYLIEYDPKEELKRIIDMQNKMNKTET